MCLAAALQHAIDRLRSTGSMLKSHLTSLSVASNEAKSVGTVWKRIFFKGSINASMASELKDWIQHRPENRPRLVIITTSTALEEALPSI